MLLRDYIQFFLFIGILALTAKPLGLYMGRVFDGSRTLLSPVLGPVERLLYRLIGVDPSEDQHWTKYAIDLLVFSAVTLAFTYAILRLQQYLPLNPAGQGVITPHLAFNTAMSFTTNTNWQSYGGESTMSYLSQMVGLAFHNFISAAVGIAVAVALIRGLARKESKGIGNFWADMIRCNLYILLPICVVFAVFLISQGMIQNFLPYQDLTTLEGAKQTIAQGPVASQVAIKMLGTNGGGFFNANAAHPFENPTALSNFLQMLSIFMIPSGLVYLLGAKVKNIRHGWAVWAAMGILFVGGRALSALTTSTRAIRSIASWAARARTIWKARRPVSGSSIRHSSPRSRRTPPAAPSMRCMTASRPLGGIVPLINMMLGEIVFGGVGAGLYGMMMYIILTVFIAGLMVGRTPEYLGKKIEGREVKYVMLAMIVMALSMLGFSAWGALDPAGLAGLGNPAGHGFTEILYAYTSGDRE